MVGRPRTVTDAEIFRAVTAAVSEDGPDQLTVAAVANRLGVSAPAVRQRFGSKRELLIAYARHQAAAADEPFDRAAASAGGPLDTLLGGLSTVAVGLGNKKTLAHHLALLHLDLTDPELGAPAIQHSRTFRARIVALIHDAGVAGELDTADPDELAELVYTIYNGALVTWALDGQGPLGDWITARVAMALAPHRPARPRRSRR